MFSCDIINKLQVDEAVCLKKGDGYMERYTKPNLELADWGKIYDVVSVCGKAHHPRAFAIDMVKNLSKIADFDQSIVYFLDATGKTVGQYQKNVPERFGKMYLHYHEAIEGTNYSFGEERENLFLVTLNWLRGDFYPKEFMDEFIYSRKLTYSCDFSLFDLNGNYRMVVSLDRTKPVKFSEKEKTNLLLTLDLLNSIYKNFFFRDEHLGNVSQSDWAKWKLTPREIEVVDLISQGVKPQGIAQTLYISLATTYKHMQHIYSKIGVSNNQELMVKLLNPPGDSNSNS